MYYTPASTAQFIYLITNIPHGKANEYGRVKGKGVKIGLREEAPSCS